MKRYYSDAIKLIKHYRLKSIFFTYFKRLLPIVAIPILILFIALRQLSVTSFERTAQKNAEDELRRATAYFEQCLNDIEKFAYRLEDNSSVIAFSSIDLDDASPLEVSQLSNEIYTMLVNYAAISNTLTEIHIYFPHSDYIISNRGSASSSLYHYDVDFDKVPKEQALFYYYDNKTDELRCISNLSKNGYPYAMVEYKAPMTPLSDLLSKGSSLAITTGTEKIIYTNCSHDEFDKLIKLSKDSSVTPYVKKTNGGYDAYSPVYNSAYSAIYYSTAYNNSLTGFSLVSVVFGIFLLILIICGLTAIYFSFRFYEIIMNTMSQFDLSVIYTNLWSNELDFLNSSIFDILEKNKTFETIIMKNVQELKQAQAQALQLQISPHFIFNTLNIASVSIMSELKRSSDAQHVISHLANIMETVLDTKNTIITIKEELDYIREFVEIEKIRFQNSFDIIYEIDDSIYERKILKFILQPIVENAFEHGIKLLTDRRGKLIIAAYRENNDTVFTVSDNGYGMNSDTLSHLNESLKQKKSALNQADSHIGLCNVHKRITLLCGDNYGLSVKSNNEGTTVTVRINLGTTDEPDYKSAL